MDFEDLPVRLRKMLRVRFRHQREARLSPLERNAAPATPATLDFAVQTSDPRPRLPALLVHSRVCRQQSEKKVLHMQLWLWHRTCCQRRMIQLLLFTMILQEETWAQHILMCIRLHVRQNSSHNTLLSRGPHHRSLHGCLAIVNRPQCLSCQ